jgi:hypothetical protein
MIGFPWNVSFFHCYPLLPRLKAFGLRFRDTILFFSRIGCMETLLQWNIVSLHSVGSSAARQPTRRVPLTFRSRYKEGVNELNGLVRELMELMEAIALCTG